MEKKLFIIGNLLFVIGFISWIVPFLVPYIGNNTNFEFPLGDLKGIVVDKKGEIICGSQAYERIQIYDDDGEYLRGWFINSGGGVFKIKIDAKDLIHIAVARGNVYYVFDTNGKLISKTQMSSDFYDNFSLDNQQYIAIDNKGNTYKIKPFIAIFPRIIKVSYLGKQSTLIYTPLHKWIFMAPFPAFFFAAAGLVITLVIEKRRGNNSPTSYNTTLS